METHYPFTLPPLPYAYDALLPELDERTMHFHHDKHFNTYVDNLNKLLKDRPVYNHDLYFKTLAPGGASSPAGPLADAVVRDFGDLEGLKTAMKNAALGQFGSGWAWLVSDREGRLSVRKTPNQDSTLPLTPLLGCDVWEHAYYLPYQNRRDEYFEAWWRLVDWPGVTRRYGELTAVGTQYPAP